MGARHVGHMLLKSNPRKALGQGIGHIQRAPALVELDFASAHTFPQEVKFNVDLTAVIPVHSFLAHENISSIVLPHTGRADGRVVKSGEE